MLKYLNKGISTPLALLIVLVLALLVGSFTFWQYSEMQKEETNLPEVKIPDKTVVFEEEKETTSPQPQESTSTVESTFTEEIATSDWETYRNEEYGFEIKYPPGAKIKHINEENKIRIYLPFTPRTLLIDKYLDIIIEKDGTKPCPNFLWAMGEEKIGTVYINNIKFEKYIGGDTAMNTSYDMILYSTVKKDRCFSFIFTFYVGKPGAFGSNPPPYFDEEKESQVFTQLLSTLKFID